MAPSTVFAILLSVVLGITTSEVVNCNGNCSCLSHLNSNANEICTLKCGFNESCKGSTLTCAAGRPCTVECSAKSSCSDITQIDASQATDVTVNCGTIDACKSQLTLICGTGKCNVKCFNYLTCENMTTPIITHANSFKCTNCPSNILQLQFNSNETIIPTIYTTNPSIETSNNPTIEPTTYRLSEPTIEPTYVPTNEPITSYPKSSPTINKRSNTPTNYPTLNPTLFPSYNPTSEPTTNTPTSETPIQTVSDTHTNTPVIFNTQNINKIYARNKKTNDILYPVLISIASFAILALLALLIYCVVKRRKRTNTSSHGTDTLPWAVLQLGIDTTSTNSNNNNILSGIGRTDRERTHIHSRNRGSVDMGVEYEFTNPNINDSLKYDDFTRVSEKTINENQNEALKTFYSNIAKGADNFFGP